MYTLRMVIRVLLCIVGLFQLIYIHGQSPTIEIPVKGEALDLATVHHQLLVISTSGIYKLTEGELVPVEADSLTFLGTSRNYSNNQNYIFYPATGESQWAVDRSLHLRKVSPAFTDELIIPHNTHVYLTGRDISVMDPDTLLLIEELDSLSGNYWDALQDGEDLWLSHISKGVYLLRDGKLITHLGKSDGLAGDLIYSMGKNDKNLYIGHKGRLTVIFGDSVSGMIRLDSLIGQAPILEIESSHNLLYLLTPDNILYGRENNFELLKLTPEELDEFVAFQSDLNGKLWTLSRTKLIRLPDPAITYFDPGPEATGNKNLYRIRERLYFTNGERVYAFDSDSSQWIFDPGKLAPKNTATDSQGHTWLIFDDEAILLDKDNADILDAISLPPGLNIYNISEVYGHNYIATRQNLYRSENDSLIQVNRVEEFFYDVLAAGNERTVVLSENGLSDIRGNNLNAVPATEFTELAPSTHHFIYKQHLVGFNRGSIALLDLRTNESRMITRGRLKILDILQENDRLWLLTEQALLALNLNSLLQARFEIEKKFSLDSRLDIASLYSFDSLYLWITGNDELLRIDKTTAGHIDRRKVHIAEVHTRDGRVLYPLGDSMIYLQTKDIPAQIRFTAPERNAAESGFVYYLGSGKSTETVWDDSPAFLFHPEKPGRYILQAVMNDGLYGEDLEAKPLIIVWEQVENRMNLYILAACLLFLIFLFFVLKRLA